MLSFAPRLPEGITRLSFRLVRRGQRLRVIVTPQAASYQLLTDATTLEIEHHGERLHLHGLEPIERPIAALPEREPPTQPPGCKPRRRSLMP